VNIAYFKLPKQKHSNHNWLDLKLQKSADFLKFHHSEEYDDEVKTSTDLTSQQQSELSLLEEIMQGEPRSLTYIWWEEEH